MIMLKQGRATLPKLLSGVTHQTSALQLRRLLAICKRATWREWLNRRHKSETSNSNSTLTLENTFKCYDLETGPPLDVELSREDALSMYTKMVEVRRLEIIAAEFYKQKKIRGFCHLYNGQEAVAVGMTSVMRKTDTVITAYRCHAWTYLMGVSMYALLAELLGVRTGCSRGKGGSMHMYADNYYGGNGIVGAQVPMGAGIALAHRYKDDDGVCIVCYGDGAANQGQIFEAYNMAKLWCLPCIFVCENNEYGMGTETSRASANTDFYMRGQYIPGLWVDGNQVLAVRSATQFAIDFAQSNGPIVLEMFTYRYMGHSMSDPGTSYRTRDEVQNVRETRDPITNFRNQVVRLCLASEEELKQIDDNVKKQVGLDAKKALQDREVDEHELTADVYAKNVEPKIRGVSGYNLEHRQVTEVCLGKPKPTPAKDMKDVPVGDAALLAAQAGKMKKDGKKTDEAADGDKTKPSDGDKTKPADGDKTKTPTKKGEGEESQSNAKVPPAKGETKAAGTPPVTTPPPAATPPATTPGKTPAAPPGKTPAATAGKAAAAPPGKTPAATAGKAAAAPPGKTPAATPAKTPAGAPGKVTAAPAPSGKTPASPQPKNPPATSPSSPPKAEPPGSGGAPKSPKPKNTPKK